MKAQTIRDVLWASRMRIVVKKDGKKRSHVESDRDPALTTLEASQEVPSRLLFTAIQNPIHIYTDRVCRDMALAFSLRCSGALFVLS